ncbi:hypothetical protein PC111_g22395, partial [Phytophthora cactorum]
PEYVTSLMQHNKEFLPVAKKKLPQSSRCALISVVSSESSKLHAAQYLDSNILTKNSLSSTRPRWKSDTHTQPTAKAPTFWTRTTIARPHQALADQP